MPSITWSIRPFNELCAAELYQLLQLRIDVFMLEQNCLYPECDDKDLVAVHLLGKVDAKVVAYARLLPENVSYVDVSIGRVVVHPDFRRFGFGKELMQQAIAYWRAHRPVGTVVCISAQLYLQRFYEELGFQRVSEMYLEDNIPHIEMTLLL